MEHYKPNLGGPYPPLTGLTEEKLLVELANAQLIASMDGLGRARCFALRATNDQNAFRAESEVTRVGTELLSRLKPDSLEHAGLSDYMEQSANTIAQVRADLVACGREVDELYVRTKRAAAAARNPFVKLDEERWAEVKHQIASVACNVL